MLGIVAARLREKWHLPAVVLTWNADDPSDDPLLTGSGRSVPGVDLGAAVLAAREAGLLLGGGGHPAAAGGISLRRSGLADLRGFLGPLLARRLEQTSEEGPRDLLLDDALSPPSRR